MPDVRLKYLLMAVGVATAVGPVPAELEYTWENAVPDGWVLSKEKAADDVSFEIRSDTGGRDGCMVIQCADHWSIAVSRDEIDPKHIEEGRIVLMDVYADPDDFNGCKWCQAGVVIQSDKKEWDQLGQEDVPEGSWKTLSFIYEPRKHRGARWIVLHIITNSDTGGKIYVDNVRIR